LQQRARLASTPNGCRRCPDTGRHDLALPDGLLRFSVELEPAIVDQLGGLGLIKPTEVRDLAAILTALRRIGITPTISCSA
jgi:hypothetical protein